MSDNRTREVAWALCSTQRGFPCACGKKEASIEEMRSWIACRQRVTAAEAAIKAMKGQTA